MWPRVGAAAGVFALLAVGWPGPGAAHLFHFGDVRSQETQMARDFRLVKELTQWGTKDFELARQVYRGELRVRERKPSEPGHLLKAEYQLRAPVPPLKALVQAVDARLGTSLDAEIESALSSRDPAGLEAVFRRFFYVQIHELLDALQGGLTNAEVSEAIFAVLADYLFTSYEVFLALSHPRLHRRVKDALGDLREALPQRRPPKPASPADFERARRRVEQLLGSLTPVR